MKTLREDKSDKKQIRETRIKQMFEDLDKKEITIEDAVKKYFETYDDDPKMNYKVMSIVLKKLCDEHQLTKQRRNKKVNRSGRVETINMIYYCNINQISPVENVEQKQAETKTKPVEQNTIQQKPTEPSTIKKNDIFDLMSKLTFAEALEKLYTGHKIVSAVSGNIYTIMNVNGQKGVTSSAEPGVIMSFFPAIEMEGSWRVMDAPRSCPFCDHIVKLNHETIGEGAYYYVCTNKNCLAHGPRASTPEQAVVKFNQRI